jgi:hypothetical protein
MIEIHFDGYFHEQIERPAARAAGTACMRPAAMA